MNLPIQCVQWKKLLTVNLNHRWQPEIQIRRLVSHGLHPLFETYTGDLDYHVIWVLYLRHFDFLHFHCKWPDVVQGLHSCERHVGIGSGSNWRWKMGVMVITMNLTGAQCVCICKCDSMCLYFLFGQVYDFAGRVIQATRPDWLGCRVRGRCGGGDLGKAIGILANLGGDEVTQSILHLDDELSWRALGLYIAMVCYSSRSRLRTHAVRHWKAKLCPDLTRPWLRFRCKPSIYLPVHPIFRLSLPNALQWLFFHASGLSGEWTRAPISLTGRKGSSSGKHTAVVTTSLWFERIRNDKLTECM